MNAYRLPGQSKFVRFLDPTIRRLGFYGTATWDQMRDTVADYFDVDVETVGLIEDEDEFGGSVEYVTVAGERVAVLDY